ncbi:MAG: type I restriction enzyme EcoKI subunit R [Candidatus Accumulibacter vicinus]|uniref:Type I restriction enzyme EcoKI subunit R n=1 Tax=Candidatus Accumulibacter vicinus TaxID=2954382 RepID=A0A084XVJ8_9PROT|nr:MAG: type I restriction enzyme EcoKI subunit R [Candidatus Accumulibacter vicinus]
MLDTGIDIPEVVNLVFFKLVRSKTKFWQMLGRGTRPCLDLFGPDQQKTFFYVFDYCQSLEYFSQDIAASEGALGEALGKQLFNARLELIGELDADEQVLDGGRPGRAGADACRKRSRRGGCDRIGQDDVSRARALCALAGRHGP